MTKLWNVSIDLALGEMLTDLEHRHNPPRFEFENILEVSPWYTRMRERAFAPPGSFAFEPPPEALKLRLTEPGIAPDFIGLGFDLASATARAAMAVDEYVSWFPVDASASTDEVQAKDYQLMLVHHAAIALDPQRSTGKIAAHSKDFGLPAWDWGEIDLSGPPPSLHWLQDFEPPAPIFYERLTSFMLATEAFAQRIEDSGISGFAFIDNENDGTRTELKLRG